MAGAWGTEFSYLGKDWQDSGRASGSLASEHRAEFWPSWHVRYTVEQRDDSIHRESLQIRAEARAQGCLGLLEATSSSFHSYTAISRPFPLEGGPNSAPTLVKMR